MKYYLVIGYQVIEKWREYGHIQLYLNDNLLESFTADNEQGTEKICHNTTILDDTSLEKFLLDSKQPKATMFDRPFEYSGSKFSPIHDQMIEKAKHKKQNKITVCDVEFKPHDIDHLDDFAKAMHKQIEKNKIEYSKWKDSVSFQVYLSQPAKFKIIELDESEFENRTTNKITIKIVGGPSNASNGFVSKNNMISLFPLFLIPEIMFNERYLEKIFEKEKKYTLDKKSMNTYPFYIREIPWLSKIIDPKPDGTYKIVDPPVQWPGPNFAATAIEGHYRLLGQPIGGDCVMDFFVHKKHRVHSLHFSKNMPRGRWQFNLCFLHVYKKLAKSLQKQHK